ncbi:uncharacterized protein LOC122792405 [Protopterus annectens]|uniref:uncharacterized protein LOC122792405 n=1 Tax=Protopterus annectens TaxID=7888 RepID=UPI001CFAAA61|nr:uncharacterized protein LOC122792405 [Protopterus annectens]
MGHQSCTGTHTWHRDRKQRDLFVFQEEGEEGGEEEEEQNLQEQNLQEPNLQQATPAKSKKKKEKAIEPPLVSEIPLYPGGKGNYIAALRTYCQKHALPIDFELVSTSGPSHRPMFKFRAIISGEAFPEGRGSSKKDAQGNAARLALDEREQLIRICLEKQASIKEAAPPAPQQNAPDKKAVAGNNTPSAFNSNTVDYIDMLTDYAAKRNLLLEPLDSEVGDPPRRFCRWKVGNRVFADCFGKTVLKARRNAARTTYHILANEFVSKFKTGSVSTHFSSSSNIVSCTESFVNRFLSDYVKKKNLRTSFVESSSSASGAVQCFCRWKIGDREFGEAWGNSRAEAKKNAARLAFYTLVNEAIENESESSTRTKPSTADRSSPSDSRKWRNDVRSRPLSSPSKALSPNRKTSGSSVYSAPPRSYSADRPSLSNVQKSRVENFQSKPSLLTHNTSVQAAPARAPLLPTPTASLVQAAPVHASSLPSPAPSPAASLKRPPVSMPLQVSPLSLTAPSPLDYTVLLLAYAQQRNLKIVSDDSYSGLSLPPTYLCKWRLDQRVIGEAYGQTLQEARRNAAKFAYELLIKEDVAGKVVNDSIPVAACSTSIPTENNILSLVIFAKRNNLKINAVDSLSNLPTPQKCCCKWMLGQQVLSEAYGTTIEEARQNSAKLAYDVLVKERNTQIKESTSIAKVAKDSTHIAACSASIPTENHILSLVVFAKRNNLKINATDSLSNFPLPQKCCCKWMLGQRVLSEAYGPTVEEARQNSAKLAYDVLVKEHGTQTKESTSATMKDLVPKLPSSMPSPSASYVSLLLDCAQKKKLKVNAVDSWSGLTNPPGFVCRWKVDQQVIGEAFGGTIDEARQKAARVAYNELMKVDAAKVTSVKESAEVPQYISYVSLLTAFAQQKRLKINSVDSWPDQSYPRKFACKWKLGQRVLGEAYGTTMEEARQYAAKMAYNLLLKEDKESLTTASFSSAVQMSRNLTYPPVQTTMVSKPVQMPTPVTNADGRKRKPEDQVSEKIKKLREEELQISLNYLRKEEMKRRVVADLRRSQCICLQLDKQRGKTKPQETWFWPKLFIIDDDDVDDEGSEDEEKKALAIADKLKTLTKYLRDRHFYCVWCGREFDDWKDLANNCPGPRAELHK